MAKDLPIDSRIVEQLAKATVRSLPDGIVELITNCDDSYNRLEERGCSTCGDISIYVNRKMGGICEKLKVFDLAEGMTKHELEKAIVFGGETSGFSSGKSVRGLFGRGLKETIIALGDGEIETIKSGLFVGTRLWFDGRLKKPLYDDEMLENIKPIDKKNGTTIDINVTNEKIRIPQFENFAKQLSDHYALRDINSSNKRTVTLTFEDLKKSLKITEPITFKHPPANKVVDEEIHLSGFGDKLEIRIYESAKPLNSPKNNPYGLAGILIKTRSAILDNHLFKFDSDPAAFYFFGEALCEGLEKRLRQGETEIIDPNRGGLEWRHEYCQALSDSIEKILEPLVLEKKKILEKKPEKAVAESTKKMLRNLCSLLNQIAKKEFEELPEVPIDPEPTINTLMVKPEVANIEEGTVRTFSIYAPSIIVENEGSEARIKYDNWLIRPLSSKVNLEKHSKHPDRLWYRYFKVIGERDGEEGNIIVKLGTETAMAKVKVAPLIKRKRGKISGRKGGYIADIKPDEHPNPMQRVTYRDGIIWIYIKFPSISKFIKSGLDGVDTPQGRLLVAELVGDAFCRALASKGMELNKYPKIPGAEVDSFNSALNELQKKYLHKIQDIIFAWKF